ncbi:MAG TPA: Spx/MgsR family RNA polymerase-binding regulatory protein [Polyangiaceae bacterium]|nr:Spx/MgsR family RNA polymerase-binding regulatory protein [Polyangiaceae bacterium]
MSQLVVFQYPKCSTCRKALAYLDRKGVSYESIDIVTHPPSRAQLARAVAQSGLPLRRFFNTSGQSYRDGKFGERLPRMTDAEALDALAADGKLIKRPLLLGGAGLGRGAPSGAGAKAPSGSFVLVGFDEDEYRARFG